MKKIFQLILVLIVTNGYAQVVRELEDFTKLRVNNTFTVDITQTNQNNVTINGLDPEDYEKVITEVINGELSINVKGKLKAKSGIFVSLDYKNLEQINLSGASNITSTNAVKTDKLTLISSGASDMELNVETTQLESNFSGASDVKLMGKTEKASYTLSGASSLKAGELLAKEVVVDISGAADVTVYASNAISGYAKGASNIVVKGNPQAKNINKTGASSASFGSNDKINVSIGRNHLELNNDQVNVGTGKHNVAVNCDTTKVSWGNTTIIVIDDSVYVLKKDKKRKNHWAGLDLGINGFIDGNGSLDLSNPSHFEQTRPQDVTQFMELNYRKSWTFSINFLEFFIPVKEHHFGIVTGLGTEWNNYELKHNVRLTDVGGSFVHQEVTPYNESYTWGYIDTNLTYTKNRFKTWFVNAPLLLEVNTGDDAKRSFHLSAGAILGYNLQTKIKYKYHLNGDHKKEKDKDDFNTNPFRVCLTARAGYGWFNVFATYSLTPLFESGKGPELYPFTVGVTLLGF